jgi:hypothetical protein
MPTLLFCSFLTLSLLATSPISFGEESCNPAVLSQAQSTMVKKLVGAADVPVESIVTKPDHDKLTSADYRAIDNTSDNDGNGYTYSTSDDTHAVVGFELLNKGGNQTLPPETTASGYPIRKYAFDFKSRATQDLHLEIIDGVEESDSHNMQSNIYMFPRKVVPAISVSADGNTLSVTLPTGEIETFDNKTKAMLSGPIKETSPVDLNPNRFTRKHPQVSFAGGNPKNVYLKNDSRTAADFRDAKTTVVQNGRSCSVLTSQLFNTATGGSAANGWTPQGNTSFKFATDAEFNAFLQSKCHMNFLN